MAFATTEIHAQSIPATITVNPKVSTASVDDDADDPAIWIHPSDPAKSVIIGTDKGNNGGLYVWDMEGRQIQYIRLGNPNNVDVRYGMLVGGQRIDIAVTNIRSTREMKVYRINPNDGTLTDITTSSGIKTPELGDPYGLCLYQRPSDGAMFVIQSTQVGATENLHQYRLEDDGSGRIKGTYIRAFGNNTIEEYVEGLVVDDELGYVYASDEPNAVRKYYADPDRGNNDQIVAFATGDGIAGDREGLAIYQCPGGTGYILLSNQDGTNVKVYRREGDNGDPHRHALLTTIQTNGSSDTDGLEVTSVPTSANFPKGFLVTHNASDAQFNLYAWEDIAQNFLSICASPQTSVDENKAAAPKTFQLEQNYPNPFWSEATSPAKSGGNPSTTIRFNFPQSAPVKLAIVNHLGQTVRLLFDGKIAAGEHVMQWDGRDNDGFSVPSGVYLYRLESGGEVQTRKLILLQ
jgi:3-phytase